MMTKTKKIITLALGMAGLAQVASAQTYVDFGGDYGIGANVDSARNTEVTFTTIPEGLGSREQAVLAIDNATPLYSVTGGDLSVTNTVYAALFNSHSGGAGNPPKAQLNKDQFGATGELYQLDSRAGGSTALSVQNHLFYWQQADFLNGGDTATLDLADLSVSASLHGKSTGTYPDGDFAFHWVIRDGNGDLFASQNQVDTFDQVLKTYTNVSLVGLDWVAFDNSSLDVRPTLESASLVDTSDITALGVLFSNYKTAEGTGSGFRMQSRVAEFNVSVVPEPSTYALLFGAATLGFVLWRRKRA